MSEWSPSKSRKLAVEGLVRDSHVPGSHQHPHHKRSCAESPAGAKEAKGTVLESSNAGVFKQVVLHLSFFHYFFSSPCFPFFLPCVFVAVRGFSLIAASGGCSRVVVHELLIAVACLVEELGL